MQGDVAEVMACEWLPRPAALSTRGKNASHVGFGLLNPRAARDLSRLRLKSSKYGLHPTLRFFSEKEASF